MEIKKIEHLKKVINEAFDYRVPKMNDGGVQFRCDGCSKKCLIISPIKKVKKNKMHKFILFKKALIENCRKKLMPKKCQS